MKLTYFDHEPPNFGDAANAIMWKHLVPDGFFDTDEAELFLGIGSIIGDHLPRTARKIVGGSGYGGYTKIPDVFDGSWDILWVRGPLTARSLGIAPELAISDAAILLREIPLPDAASGIDVGYMPHIDSLQRGDWQEVCNRAGMTLLDPSRPVEELLAKIRGARLVITEAMHGAIISDALRTPWVGVQPFCHRHRNKWLDWAGSLDIRLDIRRIAPSSLMERWADFSGQAAIGGRTRALLANPVVASVNDRFIDRAAQDLAQLARSATGQLSGDRQIEDATQRALAALQGYVRSR